MGTLSCVISASRPGGWRAYLWMGALGLAEGRPPLGSWVPMLYSLCSYLATAFAINNYFDRLSDAAHPGKTNPFNRGCDARALIPPLANQVAAAVLTVASFSPQASATYILMVFLGVAYSAPPLRLKGRAGLDVLSHSLFFGVLLYLYGVLAAGAQPSMGTVAKAVLIGVYSAFLQLRNLRDDATYDRLAGDWTMFVTWPRFSRALLMACGLASAAGASLLLARAYPICLALVIPPSLATLRLLRWERSVDLLVASSLSIAAVAEV